MQHGGTIDLNTHLQKPGWCSLGRVSAPPGVRFHAQLFYKTVRCISARLQWISFWSRALWHNTPETQTAQNASMGRFNCCRHADQIPYSESAVVHWRTRSEAVRPCWCKPLPAPDHHPPNKDEQFSGMCLTYSQHCIAWGRKKKKGPVRHQYHTLEGMNKNAPVSLLTFVLFPGGSQLKPGQHFSNLPLFHKLLLSAAW